MKFLLSVITVVATTNAQIFLHEKILQHQERRAFATDLVGKEDFSLEDDQYHEDDDSQNVVSISFDDVDPIVDPAYNFYSLSYITLPTEFPTPSPIQNPTKSPTNSPTKGPTPSPTEPRPTPNPTPNPTPAPTIPCNMTPELRSVEIINELSKYTPLDELNDRKSFSFQAATWLIENDSFYICPNDPELVQRYALAKLYYSTDGNKSWNTCAEGKDCSPPARQPPLDGDSWLSSSNECEWAFTTCDTEGVLTRLEVNGNGLKGELISELQFLTSLEVLTMDGEPNQLKGTIPTEYALLTNLRVLDFDENKLKGPIPLEIFTQLTNLIELDLDNNELTGTLPTQISNLTALTFLQLQVNGKLKGTIPTEIGLMTNLEVLGLSGTDITGTMPAAICSMREPAGKLSVLWSDCDPKAKDGVTCDCCTFCDK